jgi:hypothetical protein
MDEGTRVRVKDNQSAYYGFGGYITGLHHKDSLGVCWYVRFYCGDWNWYYEYELEVY